MITPARLILSGLLPIIAAASWPVAAQDIQEMNEGDKRTDTVQIDPPALDANIRNPYRRGYSPPEQDLLAAPDTDIAQASPSTSRGTESALTSQIAPNAPGDPRMEQLSRIDLAATLSQLSPAERRVLLQAIEGSDICDTQPSIPAIMALCQNRLETRSSEFTANSKLVLSAEDRLLEGELDYVALPTVDQVIKRLSTGNSTSNDFSEQAIASIALDTSPNAAQGGTSGDSSAAGLGEETQALVNALINQLGGSPP